MADPRPARPVVLVLSGWSEGPLDELRARLAPRVQFILLDIPTPPVGVRWLANPFLCVLLAEAVATAALFASLSALPSGPALGLRLLLLLCTAAAVRPTVGLLVGHALRTSCDAARRAIDAHDPDALVGFSWGGAVVWELLASGELQGRGALLLAPTVHAVHAVRGSSLQPSTVLTAATQARAHAVIPAYDGFCPPAQTAAIEASGVHTHTVADSHVLLGRASARLVSALLLEALGTRDVAELRRATVDMDEMELELRD